MIRLGVNIDHVATVRQARGGRSPEFVAAAHAAQLGGADQITLHLREDRRHVQDRDVERIREALALDLNLEMAATPEMIAVALTVRPDQVCLVPERRAELTTEGGLDVTGHKQALTDAVARLKGGGLFVSLFVDPEEEALLVASEIGADAVELHTGRYANATGEHQRVHECLALRDAGITARGLGLRVHAGHGLTYGNVGRIAALPEIEELNIGFAIIARALFVGLETAVRTMRDEMLRARETAQRLS